MAAPLAAGLVFAFANGGVVPSPAVVDVVHNKGTAPVCLDSEGQEVLCCAWQPDGWAIGYIAWGAVVLGWTTLLAFTLKVGAVYVCFVGGGRGDAVQAEGLLKLHGKLGFARGVHAGQQQQLVAPSYCIVVGGCKCMAHNW